jgi:predicted transposase YbfD/YdcC
MVDSTDWRAKRT